MTSSSPPIESSFSYDLLFNERICFERENIPGARPRKQLANFHSHPLGNELPCKYARLDHKQQVERGRMEVNQAPTHVNENILGHASPSKAELSQAELSDPRRDPIKPTQRVRRINHCCFKPRSFGVLCYRMDNWYTTSSSPGFHLCDMGLKLQGSWEGHMRLTAGTSLKKY